SASACSRRGQTSSRTAAGSTSTPRKDAAPRSRPRFPLRDPMTMPSLLIVEDDEDIRAQMRWALADEYAVVLAADRGTAITAFEEHQPVVTILDLGLPPWPGEPTEGLATLSAILAEHPRARVVVATGQGEKRNALAAIGAGACDFFTKPVDLDLLRIVLQRHAFVAGLEAE